MEFWKAIAGWEGRYEVSTLGRVRAIGTQRGRAPGKHIRLRPGHDGYFYVRLRAGERVQFPRVHRLVAIAFIPPVPGKDIVNHINQDPCDNRLENLEWVTNAENIRKSRRAKLSPDWVEAIRNHQRVGIVFDDELALLADVTVRTIKSVRYGERWTAQ